jgi:hypothetical protein
MLSFSRGLCPHALMSALLQAELVMNTKSMLLWELRPANSYSYVQTTAFAPHYNLQFIPPSIKTFARSPSLRLFNPQPTEACGVKKAQG